MTTKAKGAEAPEPKASEAKGLNKLQQREADKASKLQDKVNALDSEAKGIKTALQHLPADSDTAKGLTERLTAISDEASKLKARITRASMNPKARAEATDKLADEVRVVFGSETHTLQKNRDLGQVAVESKATSTRLTFKVGSDEVKAIFRKLPVAKAKGLAGL